MRCMAIFVLLLTIPLFPVFAQSPINKSEHLDSVEVPFSAFNVVNHNATVFNLEHEHATNWQIEIQNKLLYANPNGTAVVRLYDISSTEKFIEIGMGSQPDYKFWVAVNTPADGYFVIDEDRPDGWSPDKVITVQHSSNSGLSVTVGPKTAVDQLDVGDFTIKNFAVYGMGSTTDPPATNSGSVILNFLSGDPAQNPIFYMPMIVLAGTAVLIIVLVKTKKRT
ncbi:MAG TPA: hypothetical protein VFG24_01540 [Nitrosopumilaceae archaeon]|nr:hypothetical protein [Nitrosopumilaceae archaeon]